MSNLNHKCAGEMSLRECRDYLAFVHDWFPMRTGSFAGGWMRPPVSELMTCIGQKIVTIPGRSGIETRMEHPIGDTVAAAIDLLPRGWFYSVDYSDDVTVSAECSGYCYDEPLRVTAEASSAELAMFRAVVAVWESEFEDGMSNSDARINQRIRDYVKGHQNELQ